MPESVTAPQTKTKTKPKVERPKLYKVILVNDDFTPREFVVRGVEGGISHVRGSSLPR